MLILRASLQQPAPPCQLLLQEPRSGAAQQSGAQAGAKRFDLSSDLNAPA